MEILPCPLTAVSLTPAALPDVLTCHIGDMCLDTLLVHTGWQ